MAEVVCWFYFAPPSAFSSKAYSHVSSSSAQTAVKAVMTLPAKTTDSRGARWRPPKHNSWPTQHLNPGVVPPDDSAVVEGSVHRRASAQNVRNVVALQEVTEQIQERTGLEDLGERASGIGHGCPCQDNRTLSHS